MTATPHDFPAEAFADRYEVVRTFRGGEGETALLRHRRTNKEVIGKVLDADTQAAEASLLMSLQHPAIPAVREVGHLPDGRMFLLREFARGRPVAELLPLLPDRAKALAQQVLEVLAFVHLRGVLHLDLKPANIVMTDTGEVALLDFGLAVRRGRRGEGGTPFFASPEVLLGGTPDPRSDLFSLGAVLVAALWPQPGPLPLARFLRMFPTHSFWDALDVKPADFPAPFPAFLERCLARRPQRRFADAQAALEFLVGGVGRPPRTLLQPDLVALYGSELDAFATQSQGDLILRGGTSIEREQLALHLLCSLPGIGGYTVEGESVRVRRGGEPSTSWTIPELDALRLMPFLREMLGLAEDVATTAANHLLRFVGNSPTAIGYELVRFASEGLIVPEGARWSWPAAAQGRLGDHPPLPRGPVTAEALRELAAEGRGDVAMTRFARTVTGMTPEAELPLRRALAQGLLTAGEPARALPFCVDLPIERAQALLDLGRVDAARAAMPAASAAASTPELRRELARNAARIRAAAGEVESALADLQAAVGNDPQPVETQVLAALHEQLGHGDVARSLLRNLLPKVPAASAPYVRAAVLTSLGHAERRLGNHEEAHACFADARSLLLQLGHARHAATATHNLGIAAKDMGRLDEATEHLRQARGLFQHVDDRTSTAIAEAALGNVALASGDAVAAERRLATALQTLAELGAHAAAAHTRVLLARALAMQGRRDAARELLARLDDREAARFAGEIGKVRELLVEPPSTPAVPIRPEPAPKTKPTVQEPQGPSRELFRTFLAVNRRLAHESDLEKAMAMLLESAITLTGGRTGYLLVARPDGLKREFQTGSSGPGGNAFSRSLANRAMQQQRTLTGEDALADRELNEMPSIRNLQVRSAICAPFRSGTGAEGAIYVEHAGRAGAFSEQDKESLEVLADQAAIAVDRMLREEQLARELEHSRRELAVAQRSSRRDQVTLIGDSPVMRELREKVQKIAPLDLSVLILGETGTGKEVVARAIHQNGMRSRGPFVAENCSALPAELMERELFGHMAGSFTGADRDRPGLLELASGGTLFLDEVGDMPPALQAKLLRALQEKRIRRIGGSETIEVDARILAATHKDLRAMVSRGEFREDLFFRLAAVEISVPPLRQRQGDVDVLARHFLEQLCKQHGVQRAFTDAAVQQLRAYRWPGNVRELQHVIARALLLAEGDSIDDVQLPKDATAGTVTPATNEVAPPSSPAAPAAHADAPWPVLPLAEAERRTILAALAHCGGEKSAAARLLGISRTALYEKLKRYDENKPE